MNRKGGKSQLLEVESFELTTSLSFLPSSALPFPLSISSVSPQTIERSSAHRSLNMRISTRPPSTLQPDSLPQDLLDLVRVPEHEHDLTEDGRGELLLVRDVNHEG